MTVRWKPLIVLSGLFLVIAVFGLLVVTLDLVPADSGEIMTTAREEWKGGRHGNAQIHFLRALQAEPKNAKIYAELAKMYREWWEQETDPAKRAELRAERLSALADAAKYGKDPAPRRELLRDAMDHGDSIQAVLWAKKLIDLDPQDPDAHYALAAQELEVADDSASVAKHLKVLDAREPERPRTEWVRAALAKDQEDLAGLSASLGRVREVELPAGSDSTDRLAMLKLRQIDATSVTDPQTLAVRVPRFEQAALGFVNDTASAPPLLVMVGRLVSQLQEHLTNVRAATEDPARQAELKQGLESLEKVADSGFQSALKGSQATDLVIVLEYAEHLLAREQREECLAVVDQALKVPTAKLPAWAETTARLREVAVKAALLGDESTDRFNRAEPYLKGLVDSVVPTHQALGHLFLGVIELERSGVAEQARALASAGATAEEDKQRSSALNHLKIAATGLPDVAAAQALYGVALMLTGETGLGRQYLTSAQRLPRLEPRFQLWGAWAMVQAGYPEEAEPILRGLEAAAKVGTLDPGLNSTVQLLSGEILRAKQDPDSLRKARDSFQHASLSKPEEASRLQLRLAEIDVQLGEPEKGLQRIEQLRTKNQGGAAAEQLAALILSDQGQDDQARQVLDAARKRFPENGDLTVADAALWIKLKKPEVADQVLAKHLASYPSDLNATLFRARVLNENLQRPEEARKLLVSASQASESTAPLVQLAIMDISRGDKPAAEATIARIRSQWKEAAVADLLEAQLALSLKDSKSALKHLEAAIEKDPTNKVALFWKAQLGDRQGATGEAAAIYERLVREQPVKELDDGLSLAAAANWALATLSLENQDVDQAIVRLEDLLKGGLSTEMSRPVRWQLAAARSAKGQWPAAKAEIENLLKDPKTTSEERIRAANFFRIHGEADRAGAMLDEVLKAQPNDSAAVAMRAFLEAQGNPANASAMLQRAIEGGEQPASIYLMLAAVENVTQPATDGLKRALQVIDQGLEKHPASVQLVQARYRLLRLSGQKDEALRDLEARVNDDPKGQFKRLLVDLYREEGRSDDAEKVVRKLLAEQQDDPELALTLVGLVAQRAAQASQQGDRKLELKLNDETAALIREFRGRFHDDVRFTQAEAELAARAGELDRAMAISQEMDKLDRNSPAGPLIRAQLASARGWNEGVAREYQEAVKRAPKRSDLRLALGEAELAVGKVDEAIQQANWLMDSSDKSAAAVVLKVRALTKAEGSSNQVKARRAEAASLLQGAVKQDPKFIAGYHLMAELKTAEGDRAGAQTILKQGLQVEPGDSAGLSQLIQLLAEPRPDGTPAPAAELEEAATLADRLAEPEPTGNHALAVSVGYHRASQYELALPWAEKAAERLGTWVAHLNHADLVLAQAESTAETARARSLFEQAVAAYDQVLAERANQVEAINNKAWILHQYLGRNVEALALLVGYLERVDPSTVPVDVFDTLGSIQEGLNRPKEAEAAYATGLKRAPEHPVLNMHMARVLVADPSRKVLAAGHYKKATAGRDQMPPSLSAELDELGVRIAQ